MYAHLFTNTVISFYLTYVSVAHCNGENAITVTVSLIILYAALCTKLVKYVSFGRLYGPTANETNKVIELIMRKS